MCAYITKYLCACKRFSAHCCNWSLFIYILFLHTLAATSTIIEAAKPQQQQIYIYQWASDPIWGLCRGKVFAIGIPHKVVRGWQLCRVACLSAR